MLENAQYELLEDPKHLPTATVETPVEPLVARVLGPVIKSALGYDVVDVIPELPLRLGTIYSHHEGTPYADRPYPVDFYAPTRCGRDLLVEFKSDSLGSAGQGNDCLKIAKELGMTQIVDGILKVHRAAPGKQYNPLLQKLESLGLVERHGGDFGPGEARARLVEVVYIQPQRPATENGTRIIDFAHLVGVIRETMAGDGRFERFAERLEKWAEG